MTINATLCYILKDQQVLLQHKAKGLFGEDKYNAPGGKMKPSETPEEGVEREVKEETGLAVKQLNYHGKLNFYLSDLKTPAWIVHVFSSHDFSGELKSSDREGTLEWISQENMPYSQMWEDDKYWLPLLFDGKKFEGKFYFEEDFKRLNGYHIDTLEEKVGGLKR